MDNLKLDKTKATWTTYSPKLNLRTLINCPAFATNFKLNASLATGKRKKKGPIIIQRNEMQQVEARIYDSIVFIQNDFVEYTYLTVQLSCATGKYHL